MFTRVVEIGVSPTVDSKVVNTAIRAEIWPLLREHGFAVVRGRTAWRHTGTRIHVVNFQSFNDYTASVIGCTSYSFAVNLGCFVNAVPDLWGRIKVEAGRMLPKEYECHFRAPLHRSLPQRELARRDIWYIEPQGSYLAPAIHDVRMAIVATGFPWFERLSQDEELLRILLIEPEDMSHLWGFGNNPSPMRSYLTGYVALAAGKDGLASQHLTAAASSESFASKRDAINAALARARSAG